MLISLTRCKDTLVIVSLFYLYLKMPLTERYIPERNEYSPVRAVVTPSVAAGLHGPGPSTFLSQFVSFRDGEMKIQAAPRVLVTNCCQLKQAYPAARP